MCTDTAQCRQLREYLQNMHVQTGTNQASNEYGEETEHEPSAAFMMRRKLRNYLIWKKDFAKVSAALFAENQNAIRSTCRARRCVASTPHTSPFICRSFPSKTLVGGTFRISCATQGILVLGEQCCADFREIFLPYQVIS